MDWKDVEMKLSITYKYVEGKRVPDKTFIVKVLKNEEKKGKAESDDSA